MKTVMLLLTVFLLCLIGTSQGQELKKEFVDPMPQEARSAAVKVKGGTMLFLAGHTASLPQSKRGAWQFRRSVQASLRQDQDDTESRRRYF